MKKLFRGSLLLMTLAVFVPMTGLSQGQPEQGQQPQQPPSPQQRAEMLKQWLAASQQQVRAYEWIETTSVAVKGEEKSSKQKRVFFDAYGQIQKVETGSSATEKSSGPRGPLRGKMAEHKKEEMTEYMQAAAALIHSYLPPDPNRIQQAINSGKLAANPVVPGVRGRLEFHDYLKAGDVLSIEIELQTNRLLGMHVASYLDSPDDPVTMDVTEGVLPDGTIITTQTVLQAPAENLTVTVTNSGHRRVSG